MGEFKLLYAVIMAGGRGERFWPFSREACPKQFLKLIGSRTMLQQTVDRLSGMVERLSWWCGILRKTVTVIWCNNAKHRRATMAGKFADYGSWRRIHF